MANGTWVEASKCPRCGLTGDHVKAETRQLSAGRGVTRGAVLHKLYCRNSRCRWYNTSWEVQVNPDGTIPDPDAPRRGKQFPKPDAALLAQMQSNFQAIHDASLTPGGEIRNR